ncbi:DUF4038 domain-containing protein [Streptomyces sp. NPDC003247]|uniref:apiosidase-like domain-containing protein n=1 Tax=Streptomyces sp. NPDC003247 TaxID=3364677 RepID=UPI003691B1A4
MGVVYGAGSLWQWRLHPNEGEHEEFFLAPGAGWREALDFEGSTYVGLLGQILQDLPLIGLKPDWHRTCAPQGLLNPGVLYISYGEHGGDLEVNGKAETQTETIPRSYRVIDPRTGAVVGEGTRKSAADPIPDPGGEPRVYVCFSGWEA